MENLNKFVSSRGLLRSCTLHSEEPQSSSPLLHHLPTFNPASNFSVYVCTDALEKFAVKYFPRFSSGFTLVSGDSDLAVDERLLQSPFIEGMVSDCRLTSWFAQNLALSNEKLFPIPIGLDYHTAWERPGHWSIGKISPLAQELILEDIARQSRSIEERFGLAYCNWHFSIKHGDRRHLFEIVDKRICFFEQNRLPRRASWQRQAEFMFTLSPEGIGFDCHRTWETLVLGGIPIVKRTPISNLFEDLPVLIVEDWGDVKKTLMEDFINTALKKKFNFSKLFLLYWQQKIHHSNQRPPLDFMHIKTFRELLWSNRY